MRELKVDCQWFNAIGDNYQLIINCVALKTGPLSPLNNVTWVHSRSLFFEKSRLVFLENFSFYTKVKVQFWNFLLILIGNFLVLSGDSL